MNKLFQLFQFVSINFTMLFFYMIIRNRPYMTLKGSTLSNRGYERSEHPRIGLRRDACTLQECPNRATPSGSIPHSSIVSGGTTHPRLLKGDRVAVLMVWLRLITVSFLAAKILYLCRITKFFGTFLPHITNIITGWPASDAITCGREGNFMRTWWQLRADVLAVTCGRFWNHILGNKNVTSVWVGIARLTHFTITCLYTVNWSRT